jgi:DNA polymerase-3 subunit delta'
MDTLPSAQIQIVGHRWAVDLFKRQVATARVPHALLLTGPLNVGKSTLARYFAQYLNCRGEDRPCGRCVSCFKVVSGNHPDVRIWDDDTETIKIDEIRALQHELSLSRYEGQYRVAILCNFERATLSAANALLKTLEEPAPQVVLILTASDSGVLLPTIVSRCQGLALRALPTPDVIEALQRRWQATPEQAEVLAQLAAGRLGWAVRALEDKSVLERRQQYLNDLLDLLRMSRSDRLNYAAELSRDSALLRETLLGWLTIWRDMLLLQSGSQTKILNLDWQETLQNLAGQSTLTQVEEMVTRLRAALENTGYNVNPRLNLETVLLKIPYVM